MAVRGPSGRPTGGSRLAGDRSMDGPTIAGAACVLAMPPDQGAYEIRSKSRPPRPDGGRATDTDQTILDRRVNARGLQA